MHCITLKRERPQARKNKTKQKLNSSFQHHQKSLILSEQDFQGGQHTGVWSGVMDATMVSTPLRQSRVYTIWMKLCTRQVSTKLYIWLLYYMLISFGMSPIFKNSLKVPILSQLSYVKLWGGKSHTHVLERALTSHSMLSVSLKSVITKSRSNKSLPVGRKPLA